MRQTDSVSRDECAANPAIHAGRLLGFQALRRDLRPVRLPIRFEGRFHARADSDGSGFPSAPQPRHERTGRYPIRPQAATRVIPQPEPNQDRAVEIRSTPPPNATRPDSPDDASSSKARGGESGRKRSIGRRQVMRGEVRTTREPARPHDPRYGWDALGDRRVRCPTRCPGRDRGLRPPRRW